MMKNHFHLSQYKYMNKKAFIEGGIFFLICFGFLAKFFVLDFCLKFSYNLTMTLNFCFVFFVEINQTLLYYDHKEVLLALCQFKLW